MRLTRIPSAAAIILVVVATMPATVASSPATAIFLAPSEGATIPATSLVRLHYEGYSPGADSISGYLTLDGAWAGSFSAPIQGPPANGTTFNATLRGGNFTSGAHELGAVLFTDVDAPIEAAPVGIVLDLPPALTFEASYDLDARDLVVDVTLVNEEPALVALRAGPHQPWWPDLFWSGMNATFVGDATLRLHFPREIGQYTAELKATDALGQSASRRFDFLIEDRAATFELVDAQYLSGGGLTVRVVATDPDGIVSGSFTAPDVSANGTLYEQEDGSWNGTTFIRPRLGLFEGTAKLRDRYGGSASTPFTFEIRGDRITVLAREVVTGAGAYADRSEVPIPPLMDGLIEICIDACGDAGQNATIPPCVPTAQLACGGEPGIGAVRPCSAAEPAASQNLAAWAVWYAVQTADRGEVFHPSNPPLGRPWPVGPTFDPTPDEDVGACENARDGVEGTSLTGPIAGMLVDAALAIGDGLTPMTRCTSWGADVRCPFESAFPAPWAIDLTWAQSPGRTVEVRVSGVPV